MEPIRSGRLAPLLGLTVLIVAAAGILGTRANSANPEPPPKEGRSAIGEIPPANEPEATTALAGTTSTSVTIPVLDEPRGLVEIDGWLQSDVESLDDLRGNVVVVQFWTFSCSNCKATLPHLQALYAEHADDDFEIVGVHAPEFEFEEDPSAVQAAAEDLGVTWPIALDTRKKNFFGWQGSTGYWPRTFVLDREGRIRFDHIGEGGYDDLAATVRTLLGEA